MTKQKIYISGKISGVEEEAKVLFEQAEQLLIEKGFEPVNPMKLNHDHDLSWEAYMKVDIKALCDCDAIYMLSNWKESRGAKEEHYIAHMLKLGFVFEKPEIKIID